MLDLHVWFLTHQGKRPAQNLACTPVQHNRMPVILPTKEAEDAWLRDGVLEDR
jgi:putative SOS response-associated peptidase YedK